MSFVAKRGVASELTLPLRDPVSPRDDCVSDLSRFVSESFAIADEDVRGLSDDFVPGILVLMALLNDRVDSFVSDLLNDGYEPSAGPGPVGVREPLVPSSFDCWFPILTKLSRCLPCASLFSAVQMLCGKHYLASLA